MSRGRLAWVAAVSGLLGASCGGAHEWLMGDAARMIEPPRLSEQQIEATRKRRDPASPRKTALLVMGHEGTEVTDLLAPYELLSASGEFDVFTVAASSQPRPITGALAAVPDYTLREAPDADLIVIPAVADPSEAALTDWLVSRADHTPLLLSVCEGARLVAAAGLMDGRRATTHFYAIGELQHRYPEVSFRPGHRYVRDGNLLSSAGVSAALDATLHAIEVLTQRSAAERAAAEIGYEWIEEDDVAGDVQRGASMQIDTRDALRLLGNATLHRRSQRIGVLLYEGVSEVGLAAVVDTLPRTLTMLLDTFAETRVPLRTRNGMSLIASARLDALGSADLVVVPPGEGADAALRKPAVASAIASSGAALENLAGEASGTAVESSLALVARESHPDDAALVAKMIEHPVPSAAFAARR